MCQILIIFSPEHSLTIWRIGRRAGGRRAAIGLGQNHPELYPGLKGERNGARNLHARKLRDRAHMPATSARGH